MTEYYRQFAFVTSVLGGFAFYFVWGSASGSVLPSGGELGGASERHRLGRVFARHARHDFWRYLFRQSTSGWDHTATHRVGAGTAFPLVLFGHFAPASELRAWRLGAVSNTWDRHHHRCGAWRDRGLCASSPVYELLGEIMLKNCLTNR